MSRRVKSPAFQWYPRDYLVDELTVVMTLEEEGAYRRLLDYCWLEGSLPDDLDALAVMCKGITRRRMEKLWERIRPCFKKKGGRWRHARLDRERRTQLAHKKAKSLAGKKGAEAKHGKGKSGSATPVPVAKPSSASASASATAVRRDEEPSSLRSEEPSSAAVVGEFLELTGSRWRLRRSIADWCSEIEQEPKYAGADIAYEVRKCTDWHVGAGQKPKNPDIAIRNWLEKAAARARASPNGRRSVPTTQERLTADW